MRNVFVSCREAFSNTMFFHPETELASTGVRVKAKYPYVREAIMGPNIAWRDFVRDCAGLRVLWNVHGYRSDHVKCGEKALNQISEFLIAESGTASPFDVNVMFMWPGSWEAAAGFMTAALRAGKAGAWMRACLNDLVLAGVKSIDVQTHSLGGKVALEALAHDEAMSVNSLTMCAAAVDQRVLEAGAKYYQAARKTMRKGLYVAYSRRDPVLGGAYRLAPQNWFTPALGWAGLPKFTEAHATVRDVDFSAEVASHSGYRSCPRYYQTVLRGAS